MLPERPPRGDRGIIKRRAAATHRPPTRRRHLRSSPAAARPTLPADLAFVLCDQDPLCIVEQQNFDQLASLVACFGRVEGPKRRQLIDSLCSSLTCLNAWIDRLLGTPADALDADAVRQHRSAFKAYIFSLSWISGTAGREARNAAAAAASQASGASQVPAGRGRKKKASDAEALAGWDWAAQFPKVVKAVAQAFSTDLWALFRPSGPEEAMLIKATQLVGAAGAAAHVQARQRRLCWGGGIKAGAAAPYSVPPSHRRGHPQATSGLEDPGALKSEEQAANAAHILAMAALKYNQLENVTGAGETLALLGKPARSACPGTAWSARVPLPLVLRRPPPLHCPAVLL